MIANEVTVLLDKACEIFINDLTVRAFLVANSSNRRTINTPDIVMAISRSDMFDFLIDIVPVEPHTSTESPSTSTKPPTTTSSTSAYPSMALSSAMAKRRRQTLPETPDPSHRVDPSPSAATPQAFPPPPVKKKRPNNKVNRNLLPEEVAVPISDTELIKKDRSAQFSSSSANFSSDGRLLAVPIADSDLIPPQPLGSRWELAVPISSHEEESLPSVPSAPRSWEMAVPISDSSSRLTVRNWEVAVPIVDNDSFDHPPGRSNQKPDGRPRNWDLAVPDLAVPIREERLSEDDFSDSEDKPIVTLDPEGQSAQTSGIQQVARPDAFTMRNNTHGPGSWELAVPIPGHQSTRSEKLNPSEIDHFREATSNDRNPPSSSFMDPVAEVPIDPSLSNYSSFVKVEDDVNHLFPSSTRTDTVPVHLSAEGSTPFIKQEEL